MRKGLYALLAAVALAAGGTAHAAGGEVKLDKVIVDVADLGSLQSGARTYVNYCLGCHGLSLVRYNALRAIGLTDDQIRDNLMFSAEKVGEPMRTAMNPKEAKSWFGAPPPDLSVIARSRGADWLYSYLRGFYRDPTTQTGWNNTVYANVGMPHALWTLQGERVRKSEPVLRDGKPVMDHGKPVERVSFETVTPGSQTPQQFDATVRDLVAFLVWAGEPQQLERRRLGVWVLFALTILIFISYFLYKSFWKDVH